MRKLSARVSKSEPKGTRSEPKGAKSEPKASQREPKGSKGTQREPKGPKATPKEAKRHTKDSPAGLSFEAGAACTMRVPARQIVATGARPAPLPMHFDMRALLSV